MKRIGLVFILFVISFCFFACNKNNTEDEVDAIHKDINDIAKKDSNEDKIQKYKLVNEKVTKLDLENQERVNNLGDYKYFYFGLYGENSDICVAFCAYLKVGPTMNVKEGIFELYDDTYYVTYKMTEDTNVSFYFDVGIYGHIVVFSSNGMEYNIQEACDNGILSYDELTDINNKYLNNKAFWREYNAIPYF